MSSVFPSVSLMQFVEIKGSVFKKFEKNNLFQMSNSGKTINVESLALPKTDIDDKYV